MPLKAEEIQIFYEISMSIGSELDCRSMLKEALGKYLRKLNLSASCLLRKVATGEGKFAFEPYYRLPKMSVLNRASQMVEARIDSEYDQAGIASLQAELPFTVESSAGEKAYFFDLPDFGILVLVKSEGSLRQSTVRSLAPLNRKLAHALSACLQKEALSRSEERLEKANEQLQEWNTDKLSFIQYISHELNTPLNWIGSLNMIEEETLSPDSQRCVEFVRKGFLRISKLAQLASDYFEKSRLNWPGQPTQVLLAALREELRSRFESKAQVKGVPLTFEGDWSGELSLDAKGLLEVLESLIENAVGFSDFGEAVKVELAKGGETIRFRVEDQGVGIEPNLQGAIFKPCQIPEHKRTPGGYGFSLPCARLICEANKWSLKVESEGLGQGSCFELTL
ncbi:sensor histidine kinase [Pelagicoccus mobilis]|uniref:histidine kinase n=1 Tax=Pelagicoccus mobilis TaxID=415221 RepID=A0A934S302_9BACT|nr:HAMP domain-containing sensor histidine kinase [Pelagicoccus mobilis]MBK1880260.1 HAMP domain-containing histidine kinase [Pelagicoccus mobilis]